MSKMTIAVVAAALSMGSAAQAATFSILGGDPFVLQGDFNPAPSAPGLAPGVGVVRNGALSLDAKGIVTVSYVGTEAGYRNQFWLEDLARFDNKSASNPSFSLTLNAGFVPFDFRTLSPSGTVANGDSTGYFKSIALLQSSPNIVYALFNDSSTSDKDYDDLVVRMEVAPVPLPAAAWLLLGSLGGLGFLARRRRSAA